METIGTSEAGWCLVTGAKGFIGSHVVQRLRQEGGWVGGIGHGHLPPHEQMTRGLAAWVNGDVSFANLQSLAIRLGRPTSVIHLAGGSSVGKSFEDPREDFSRTVESTVEVLEWMRQTCPDCPLVVASTAAVYGDGYDGPIPENAALRPCSPYGTHKAVIETLCQSYCSAFGLNVKVIRLFSVYGPGLLKQLVYDLSVRLNQQPDIIELGGNGDERRDFFFVADATRLLCLARRWDSDDCVICNGGTGVATTIREIAEMVRGAWHSDAEICFTNLRRVGDPISMVADVSDLGRRGFQYEVTLRKGLVETVSEYAKLFSTR